MVYTAVFQNQHGEYVFERKVASHDRRHAWEKIHEERIDKESCLALLIDGHATIRTFEDIVENPW